MKPTHDRSDGLDGEKMHSHGHESVLLTSQNMVRGTGRKRAHPNKIPFTSGVARAVGGGTTLHIKSRGDRRRVQNRRRVVLVLRLGDVTLVGRGHKMD